MESERINSSKPQLVERNGKRRIMGYACRYYDGTPDTECDFDYKTKEIIEPRIFQKVVRTGDQVKLTIDHNPAWKLGYCTIDEDENGVWFEYDIDMSNPVNQRAVDMFDDEHVGASFTGWTRTLRTTRPDGTKLRRMFDATSFDEVCISFDPAYPAAAAVMRSRKIEIERQNTLLRYKLLKLKDGI